MLHKLRIKISDYCELMRFDKPIGWLLLLWPTLWALWLASQGTPKPELLWIFIAGVFTMRSAGCVINDFADREIDPQVERTHSRPIAAGRVSPSEALLLFALLSVVALMLLIQLPMRVWPWALPALALTVIYPFMKRFIQAPQIVLGLAFSFSIPMVYVAVGAEFDVSFYALFLANVLWVVAYDTEYAMSDREDDVKIGVKSTAIWFGRADRLIIGVLQTAFVLIWILIATIQQVHASFYIALVLAAALCIYQQQLIYSRERLPCFRAFINNGWLGGVLWFGLLAAF